MGLLTPSRASGATLAFTGYSGAAGFGAFIFGNTRTVGFSRGSRRVSGFAGGVGLGTVGGQMAARTMY